MAIGNDPSSGDKGMIATYVKARANHPNLVMREKEWAYLCFAVGQQDKDAPVLVCVHRSEHTDMQDFVSLADLNAHMSTCFAEHEQLVLGKCSLGKPDFSDQNAISKKARNTYYKNCPKTFLFSSSSRVFSIYENYR